MVSIARYIHIVREVIIVSLSSISVSCKITILYLSTTNVAPKTAFIVSLFDYPLISRGKCDSLMRRIIAVRSNFWVVTGEQINVKKY